MTVTPKIDEPFEKAANPHTAEIIQLYAAKPEETPFAPEPKSMLDNISDEGKALLQARSRTYEQRPMQQQPMQVLPSFTMMRQQQHIGGLLFKK